MKITLIPVAGIQGETRLKEAAATELRTVIELVRAALNQSMYPGRTDCYVGIEAIYADRVVVVTNGRFYAYPYKLTDSNQVELGTPEEVILEHKPVSAMRESAQGIFMEARDEKGLRWLMKIIDVGESLNRIVYSDKLLRESAPLFDGARVFVKSDDEHLAGKGKSFRNLIGRIAEPKFVEGKKPDGGHLVAVLELVESAGAIPAMLLEAWKRDMAKDLFGFSIDAYGTTKIDNGRRVAQKITKVNSVDLIIEPGAGGQLINLIEAKDPTLEADMKLRERMIEAVKKANDGKLPDGLDIDNDEQLEVAYREAIKPPAAPKVESEKKDVTVTPEDLRMVEARGYLREALASSNLPEHARDRVRGQFADRNGWDNKAVDAAIKGERDYIAKFVESGKPSGLGDDLDIIPGKDRAEKIATMFDAFFNPAHKEHRNVRSFKECYVEITGDRRVTGAWENVDKTRLREAMGERFAESLDTGGLTNVLGDAIRRAMIREYRAAVDFDGFRRICSIVSVADFRTNERVRFGGYGDLPAVNQGAAYAALSSPTDEKATYAVTKRGGTEDMTLEAIKNDDVGLIQRIPVKLGRTGKRTLAKFVFDFIRTNPNIYDGTALFTAGHGNLGSAALDATSLAARRLAMLKQSELSSADRLGIGPKSMLIPLDLQSAAVDLFKLGTNNERNFVQSLTLDIIPVWYWTDATDWALAADPLDIPGLEVGFLDGNEEPELFVQDNPTVGSMFTNDKLTWKIRHIYSGAITDYRAFDKSVVA